MIHERIPESFFSISIFPVFAYQTSRLNKYFPSFHLSIILKSVFAEIGRFFENHLEFFLKWYDSDRTKALVWYTSSSHITAHIYRYPLLKRKLITLNCLYENQKKNHLIFTYLLTHILFQALIWRSCTMTNQFSKITTWQQRLNYSRTLAVISSPV